MHACDRVYGCVCVCVHRETDGRMPLSPSQLVPALKSPFEEFIESWRQVTSYFVEQHGKLGESKTATPSLLEYTIICNSQQVLFCPSKQPSSAINT